MDLSAILKKLDRIEKLIRMNKTVLTIDETAEYTGLSRSYLYKLTAKGEIPFSKPRGKLIYFSKKKIDEWLLSNKHKSAQEIKNEALEYTFRRKKF